MPHYRFRHLWAYVTPSFARHIFRHISGEMWYNLPIHRCSFWFLFNLKYIFVSLCMYNSRIKLLPLISPIKIDVKPEKFDCEKTELSGITDRSHKATVISRLVTGLGHQGVKEFFEVVQILHRQHVRKQWICIQYAQDIFSGGEKVFPWRRSPPRSYGPGHQMIRHVEITLQVRLVGYMCMYERKKHGERVPLTFSGGEDIICHVPHFFSLSLYLEKFQK